MKRLILCLLVLFCLSSFTSAQILIRLQGGFGLPAGSELAGTDMEVDDDGEIEKNEGLYYSGGEGIRFMMIIETDIMENIGLALSGGYMFGGDRLVNKESGEGGDDIFLDQSVSECEYNKTTYFIPLGLTVKLKTEINSLKPYMGFGPTFVPYAKAIQKGKGVLMNDDEYEVEIGTTYNFSMGFHALVGSDYMFSENLGLNFEIRLDQLSLQPKKQDKIVTIDGKDIYGDIRDENIEYVEDTKDDDPDKLDEPRKENIDPVSADSLSIMLGLVFKF